MRFLQIFYTAFVTPAPNILDYVALAIIDESGKEFVREFKPQRLFVSTPNEIIKKGIPLDSIAFDPETHKYMSEMTTVERNKYEGEELLKQQNFIKEIFSMNRK